MDATSPPGTAVKHTRRQRTDILSVETTPNSGAIQEKMGWQPLSRQSCNLTLFTLCGGTQCAAERPGRFTRQTPHNKTGLETHRETPKPALGPWRSTTPCCRAPRWECGRKALRRIIAKGYEVRAIAGDQRRSSV